MHLWCLYVIVFGVGHYIICLPLDYSNRKEKDPLKPKHPVSAFFLFMNERRADLVAEKKNVLEVGKITGEEWKNMTEKEKAPYEEVHFFWFD